MAQSYIPIIKVYLQDGSVVIDLANGVTYVAAPVNVSATYKEATQFSVYDDRVSLYVLGTNSQQGFTDKFPDSIRDQAGNKIGTGDVQTLDDVRNYFVGLGIGQSSGTGIVDQTVTDSPNAVSGSAVIDYVEGQGGGSGITKQQSIAYALIF